MTVKLIFEDHEDLEKFLEIFYNKGLKEGFLEGRKIIRRSELNES